ncbi:MAG TPA: Ig-like domain-containing protein, partial [Bacteroidales bacterium]|nr:Ig-like domain-containing protein [Bacteroidales bacterium]
SLLNPIYTPGPGDIAAGGCTLTLTASSAPPCPSTQNSLVLTIQQCPINQAPVFLLNGLPVSAYAMNGLFAHPLSFCLELEDPENDPVSLGTVLQAPIHGTLSGLSDGDTCATYHPYPLFSGTDQFVITGCDAGGRCDTAMVSVSIQLPPYNLAPFLLHNSLPADTLRLNVQMNLASVLCLSVFDPEGEAVDVLQVLMAPDHGLTGGLADGDTCISYAPDTAFSGYDTLSILLCDSSGACDTFYLVLHVLDLNIPYAPQTMDDACQGAEDVALNCPVLLNDFDINMDIAPGSLALLSLPQHGLAQADTLTGMIHYLPLADYWGQDSLEYVICDSSGLCDTAKVRLMLLPVYDPPRPDTFAVGEDSLLLAPVLLNDSFFGQVIDTSTFQVVVAPKHGLAFFPAGSGVFHYLPSPDYFGVDSVEYRHCDTSGACGTAWVRVNVQAVNDLPRVAHVNGVPQGWPGQVTLSACVNSLATWCFGLMDAEGDMASIDGLTAPGLPGVQITRLNDSCFSLMPPPGFSGTALLKLVVHDPMLSGVINLNLVVHPNPSVSAGDDTLICPGALFHASSATSSHASAWLWSSQGSGVFLDPGLLHATYVASNQDILNGYSDLRVIAFGLSPCTTRDTSYIRVGFRPMPALELGLDTTLCLNYRITLDAGPGMAAYSWSTGGSVRYETVDTSNLPFPGGAVSVTITDVQGCTNDDQISITFVGCPGFDEHPWYAPPRLWPNPAKDRVYLAFGNASPDRLVIQLADMSGQVFRQQCLVALSGDATFELDVSDLVSGIYLLHCQRGEASHTLKLILLP